jgi:UDP-glucose 4-epimerase
MTDRRVLLIGGAGFLGSRLANTFVGNGFEVAIFDTVKPGCTNNEIVQFTGDLRDPCLVQKAISQYPRVVYLAHETHIAPSADRLSATFLSNLELFLTVLEAARESRVSEFTLLSSGGAVYGEPIYLPIREDHPKNPRSPYGIAKLTMEKYLAMAAGQDGFRQISIRPSNPYGPGQNFRSAQGIVAVAMSRIAHDEMITIRGDGSAIKDYIFVDDFAEACVRLISTSDSSGCHSNILKNVGITVSPDSSSNQRLVSAEISGPFNIGSGIGVPLRDIIAAIERTVRKSAALKFEPAQTGDVSANVLDISKIQCATGWTPSTSLAAGLARTWDWMGQKILGRAGDPGATLR